MRRCFKKRRYLRSVLRLAALTTIVTRLLNFKNHVAIDAKGTLDTVCV